MFKTKYGFHRSFVHENKNDKSIKMNRIKKEY